MSDRMGTNHVDDRRKTGSLERHVQTILGTLAVAAITFVATSLYNDKGEKAMMVAQLTTLNQQVAELRGEIKTMQASFATKDQVADHENRIRLLEQKK